MININIPLFGSLLLTPLLFLLMPVRRALVMSYCLLWMFLPVARIQLPGLPPLDKPSVIGLGVFIALLLLYADLIMKQFRPRWFDLPVVMFALVMPMFSAMINGLGFKAGLYEVIQMLFLWVVPYFAGRIILGDEMGVKELATGIFFAALIYAPLAWLEMVISPQLHRIVYGYHPHKFNQSIRGWSYRPVIFMGHGIMTTMWLVAGAVCGAWLLRHKQLRWNGPFTIKNAVYFVCFTAAASNSMGALVLMIVAFTVLHLTKRVSPAMVLVPLLLVSPVYIVARSSGVLAGEQLTALVEPISSSRAASLGYRLYSEDAYLAKAWQQPIWGWGGEGRHRPIDEVTGQEIGASDGLWIIVFGKTGLIGLVSLVMTLLCVPVIAVMIQSTRVWRHPRFAAASVLIVLMPIYMVDNLLNAMINPIYMLVAGGLAGFVTMPLGKRFAQKNQVAAAERRPRQPQREDQRPVGIAI